MSPLLLTPTNAKIIFAIRIIVADKNEISLIFTLDPVVFEVVAIPTVNVELNPKNDIIQSKATYSSESPANEYTKYVNTDDNNIERIDSTGLIFIMLVEFQLLVVILQALLLIFSN